MKRSWIFLVLVMVLLLPESAGARSFEASSQSDPPNWIATYWDNRELSGTPIVVQAEENLHYDWGTGSPHPRLPADRFSVRWLRYITVSPGTYNFVATSDDGIRVWVDGTLILDKWYDQAVETYHVHHYLSAEPHLVKVEYYENTGFAVAQLNWVKASQAVGKWRAEYYNNTVLGGPPVLVRKEAMVDYDWGRNSPDIENINADNFSARWTRTLDFPSGTYTFKVVTDDGARLWVDGELLINAWHDQEAKLYYERVYLSGGPVALELQYYEHTGYARIRLSWEPPIDDVPTSQPIIVDDQDPSFIRGGAERGWRTEPEGHDGRLTWTYNHDEIRADYNWGRWYPELAAARYEVFVYIPRRYASTTHARYSVAHANGVSLQVVDQASNGGRWISLGTYRFRGNGSGYVALSDITFEPYLSRYIAFDAAKWELRETR